MNYAGFAPVLVEGFKELRARIVHLEQQQQQQDLYQQQRISQSQPQRQLADEETVQDGTTSHDSPVSRQESHEGGVDVFEHELVMLAGEAGSGCRHDHRIRRLEREMLDLRRMLEGITPPPRD